MKPYIFLANPKLDAGEDAPKVLLTNKSVARGSGQLVEEITVADVPEATTFLTNKVEARGQQEVLGVSPNRASKD